jgi:hypothetical protein
MSPDQRDACARRIPDPRQRREFLQLVAAEEAAFAAAWQARRDMWTAYRCFSVQPKRLARRVPRIDDECQYV